MALWLAAVLSLPAAGGERFDIGAWSAAIPGDPADPCELTTGGYDHAVDEQSPLLLIAVHRDDPASPLRANVMATTELTQPELLRASVQLRVDGPRPRTVPLMPSAIVETEHDRRVTFRPRFTGAEQAGIRALIDAMRAATRATVEINGLQLEPAFSLDGLDAAWQRLAPVCGISP